jgi:hypothetical protein
METAPCPADTVGMDENTRHSLMDQAERLALEIFGENAEAEHIEAVFERLAWNWCRGLTADGATTVH